MKKKQIVFLMLLILLCLSFNFTYASISDLHHTDQTFSFSISDKAGFYLYGKEYTNTDNSIALVDKKEQFTALITSDLINDKALINMRKILGNSTSSDQKIFSKIFEYKISHFKAMVEHNKNDFYCDSPVNPSPQTYIKIFKEYNQILFEEDSNIIFFNTIETNNQSILEDTSINITIPSYTNMAIYSIKVTGKKGFLTKDNINRINLLIKGLSIPNLNSEFTSNSLDLFLDTKVINRANQGIYPNLKEANIEFVEYINEKHNYKVYHPSTFIPYLKNSMTSSLDYVSFKIAYNSYYSIFVENLVSPNTYEVDKKGQLNIIYNNEITILESGKTNNLNKNYNFLKYKIEKNDVPLYVIEVYILHNSKLFTFALSSYFEEPPPTTIDIFNQIFLSLEFTKPYNADNYTTDNFANVAFGKFTNDLTGYSFVYPNNWTIDSKSETENSTTLHVNSPEYSTSVDILINQSTIVPTFLKENLFNIPYANTTHKILNTKFRKKDDILYIYKLINFLDKRDRYRLAYSIDIIYDNKIYSLFISINEFLASGTDFTDERLMYIIDTIIDSFDIENNIVYLRCAGQKTGFTKKDLQKILRLNTLITHPVILNSKSGILVYPSILILTHKPTIFSFLVEVLA